MSTRAILFDFDYTLGDGTEGIVGSFHYAFDRMGLPRAEREAIRQTIGMSLDEGFHHLTGLTGRTSEFRALYRESANEILLPNTHLFADVVPVLRQLRANRFQTGIVTNKNQLRMEETLEYFHLNDIIDLCVGGDTAGASKPDPGSLLYALQQLAMEPSEVLYVGDSLIDEQAARAAGIPFAAVTTGTTRPEAFDGTRCLFTSPNLTGLVERLGMPLPRTI